MVLSIMIKGTAARCNGAGMEIPLNSDYTTSGRRVFEEEKEKRKIKRERESKQERVKVMRRRKKKKSRKEKSRKKKENSTAARHNKHFYTL